MKNCTVITHLTKLHHSQTIHEVLQADVERGIASQPLNPLINSITDGEVVSISQVQQEQADVILIERPALAN